MQLDPMNHFCQKLAQKCHRLCCFFCQ